jgi:hypothetical protein
MMLARLLEGHGKPIVPSSDQLKMFYALTALGLAAQLW